jgi:Na+-transporting methylmalonyl-CoA/oxaloacetate decarboxylase gamma subunit
MRAGLGVAGNVAAVLIVGYAVLYGLGLARSREALRLIGVAYLVGWGTTGAALSYALMAGVDFRGVGIFLVLAMAVLVIVGIGRLTPSVPPRSAPPVRSPVAKAAVAVGAAVVVVAAVAALILAIRSAWIPDEDAIYFWVPHAEVIHYTGGLWLQGGDAGVGHPEYPPLVAAMYALAFAFAGGFHPSLLSIEQCLLGLAFVGSALALLDRFVARWLSFPSIALLTIAPGFFSRLHSLLPDQTLAYFVATAALACVLWLREGRIAWLALGVILSISGTLTKLEGESYAFLLATILVVGAALQRKWRIALLSLALFLGLALAVAPWRLWLGAHDLPTSATDYRLSSVLHPAYMAHRIGRVPYSLHHVMAALFQAHDWLVIVPLALCAIIVAFRRVPSLAAASAVWLLAATFGLIFIYWAGQFDGTTLQVEVPFTVHRVAATIVIVAAIMTPIILGLALERPPSRRTQDGI